MARYTHQHTLTVFDAFLRHARAADARAARSQAAAAGAVGADTDEEAQDTAVTRVGPMPKAPAAPQGAAVSRADLEVPWEDTTRERPDVVRAMMANPLIRAIPARVVDEQSIIVDEDGLTDPEFERSALLGAGELRPGPMPVEQFVQEMSVLIKYGHTGQAADETERWIASHPDDLAAQVQLAEFQMARLDRDAAIDRFVALVGRLVERGEDVQAKDLVNRLRRDAPGDRRVGALAHRVGRS